MLFRFIYLLLFIFLFTVTPSLANNPVSIELNQANLTDAIRLLAKFIGMNVIISPTIKGTITLHLNNATPDAAFDLLLTTQGLAKWKMGNTWFIATHDELIKRKQEEIKWQELVDEASPVMTRVWQIKYGKAQEIASLIQADHISLVSKRGRVKVDKRTNVVCVQDIETRLNGINRLIRLLDVPVQQVLIEARLVSIEQDCERELGISFAVKTTSDEGGQPQLSLKKETRQYSIAMAKLADSSLLDVKLSALENAGQAELLSSPRLFTANQQQASIEAGEEVPYQETSEGGGTAVAFKKAVLGLTVTPQILPGNNVLLQLQINQDRPSNRLVQGVPAISTRQIVTNVLLKNGQTIVLGGIYETNQETAEERIPFVSQLPVIGWLFKQTKIRKNKRELLIFVTPKIIAQER